MSSDIRNEDYRMLVENMSDWIWQVDANGVYTYSNPKVKDLLGYEPHEIIGKTPFDLMDDEEAEKIGRIFGEIVSEQKPFSMLENINLHKNGNKVVLETSGVPIFDDNGSFCGYCGIDRDITEHKRQNNILKSVISGTSSVVSYEFFKSFVRNLATALDVDFILLGELATQKADKIRTVAVWARDTWAENFEYDLADTPCENVMGKQMCTYAADVQKLFPKDTLLKDMGIESYSGVPLVASNGSPMGILVALHSKPLKDISLVQSILSIFASRAAVELERRRYEEDLYLYGEIVNHMNEGTMLVRASDGVILSASAGLNKMFGYNADELLSMNARTLIAAKEDEGASGRRHCA
ncbi:MAG: PAS domain S-box protein [Nitrospirota bacterium]|nr:PAS domain S-box protein [Nitrospirota bacterium]